MSNELLPIRPASAVLAEHADELAKRGREPLPRALVAEYVRREAENEETAQRWLRSTLALHDFIERNRTVRRYEFRKLARRVRRIEGRLFQ